MSLLELFWGIDDFWQRYEPTWHETLLTNSQQRIQESQMSMSELMTIVCISIRNAIETSKPTMSYCVSGAPCGRGVLILHSE
jgi:hypothetical protein